MSSSNNNPYRSNSAYNVEFAAMKSKQISTKGDIIKVAIDSLKKTEKQASADINVLFSPRETSKRGDCRGNMSAQGHLYFVEKLAKKEGEEQKFRLRYRKVALEPRTRSVKGKVEVKAEKVAVAKVVKAKKAKVAKVETPVAPVASEVIAPVAVTVKPEVVA